MNREYIKEKFLNTHFMRPYQVSKLPADASFRSYERVSLDGQTYILMDAPPDKEEVLPFIKVGEFLYNNEFSAPQILNQDIQNGLLLLEDFGQNHYSKILLESNKEISENLLYRKAIDVLIRLHNVEPTLDVPHYSIQLLLQEACLLVDWYFKAINGEELSASLREEYIEIWSKLLNNLNYQDNCLVLRDYHADNLMWLEDRVGHKKVGLLDFQDAVIGSVAYDVVSLLEDARRDLGNDIANGMINYYLERMNYNRKEFLADYVILGAQRNCKIVGVFARKAMRDNDVRYLKLLPRVWSYIHQSLSNPLLLPLRNWFNKVSILKSNIK
jgi:aminoglycoside/choline kinase family phosphotransferase